MVLFDNNEIFNNLYNNTYDIIDVYENNVLYIIEIKKIKYILKLTFDDYQIEKEMGYILLNYEKITDLIKPIYISEYNNILITIYNCTNDEYISIGEMFRKFSGEFFNNLKTYILTIGDDFYKCFNIFPLLDFRTMTICNGKIDLFVYATQAIKPDIIKNTVTFFVDKSLMYVRRLEIFNAVDKYNNIYNDFIDEIIDIPELYIGKDLIKKSFYVAIENKTLDKVIKMLNDVEDNVADNFPYKFNYNDINK